MSLRIYAVVTGVLLACSSQVLAADTLVVSSGSGNYKPGLATSWSADGNRVTFVLGADTDAKQVAAFLKERLASAEIASDGHKVTISGIALPTLLDQLSVLAVTGNGDALATLAALGGSGPTGEQPEAGGSIRASKPTALPSGLTADSQATDRYEAQVLEITPQAFPQVVLKLKIRRTASATTATVKLSAGKVVDCGVAFATIKGAIDYSHATTQQNVGAFYLKKGDRVVVRFVQEGERLLADWIARK